MILVGYPVSLKTSRTSHVLESLFNKIAGLHAQTPVLSCKICEIFKKDYFEEQLQTTPFAGRHMKIVHLGCISNE